MPDQPAPFVDDARIAAAILTLVAGRGADRSICPSEAARALATDWQPLMRGVRRVAMRLAGEGRIDILRNGRPIAPDAIKGVIRLRLRPPAAGR